MITVFLGGTCNCSTWREELINMLDSNKVQTFNPVVDRWDNKAQVIEDYHKKNDTICLYVITPELKNIYSIFEVGNDGASKQEKTVVCILPERNGLVYSEEIYTNLVKIKHDLIANGVVVYDSLEEVADFLNHYTP